MLSISKLTDYATLLMTHIAQGDRPIYNAKTLAEQSGIAVPTVSKLLKCLAHANLLDSHRGVKGGYNLVLSPEQISITQIIEAIEGQISLTSCSHAVGTCDLEASCNMRSNWRLINIAIMEALQQITLADMVKQRISPTKIHSAIQQRLGNCDVIVEQS